MARRGKLVEEYREFTHEILLRLDRIADRIQADVHAQRQENREYFDALHTRADLEKQQLDELLEHSRELREECRDQSKALMHVLAKLDNGGPASATS